MATIVKKTSVTRGHVITDIYDHTDADASIDLTKDWTIDIAKAFLEHRHFAGLGFSHDRLGGLSGGAPILTAQANVDWENDLVDWTHALTLYSFNFGGAVALQNTNPFGATARLYTLLPGNSTSSLPWNVHTTRMRWGSVKAARLLWTAAGATGGSLNSFHVHHYFDGTPPLAIS